jgi:hypothetical protein
MKFPPGGLWGNLTERRAIYTAGGCSAEPMLAMSSQTAPESCLPGCAQGAASQTHRVTHKYNCRTLGPGAGQAPHKMLTRYGIVPRSLCCLRTPRIRTFAAGLERFLPVRSDRAVVCNRQQASQKRSARACGQHGQPHHLLHPRLHSRWRRKRARWKPAGFIDQVVRAAKARK